MKRTIALALTLALIATAATAFAQEYKQALRYELKAGFVSTFATANDYEDTGVGYGWAAGGGLFLPLFHQNFGFNPEIYYVKKETVATIPTVELGAQDDEYTFNTEWVEVPLMAQWAFTNDPGFRAYLIGGGIVSLNLSATLDYTVADTGEKVSEDITDTSSYDIAPVVGLGLRAAKLVMEFRFGWGLTQVGEEEGQLDANFSSSYFLMGLSF
jgi:hypothetical protein